MTFSAIGSQKLARLHVSVVTSLRPARTPPLLTNPGINSPAPLRQWNFSLKFLLCLALFRLTFS